MVWMPSHAVITIKKPMPTLVNILCASSILPNQPACPAVKYRGRRGEGYPHEPVDDVLREPRQVARLAVGAGARDKPGAGPDFGRHHGRQVGPIVRAILTTKAGPA